MKEGIKQADVFAAAEQLQEQGITPSARAVRDHLGTGSMTTILKHLSAWREINKAAKETSVDLSPALLHSIRAELVRVIQDERRSMSAQSTTLQDDINQLQKDAEKLENSNLHLRQMVTELGSERDMTTGKASQLAADIESLNRRLECAIKETEQAKVNEEKERYLAASLKDQVAGLERALQESETAFHNESTQRAASDQKVAVLESKLASADEIAEKSDQRIADFEARLSKNNDEFHRVQADLTATLRQLQDATARADRAERDAEGLLIRLTALEELSTRLSATLDK